MDSTQIDVGQSAGNRIETRSRVTSVHRLAYLFPGSNSQLYANGRQQVAVNLEVAKENSTRTVSANGEELIAWSQWVRVPLSQNERISVRLRSPNSPDLPHGWSFTTVRNNFNHGLFRGFSAQSNEPEIVDVAPEGAHTDFEIVHLFLSSTTAQAMQCVGEITLDFPNEFGQRTFTTAAALAFQAQAPLRIHANSLVQQFTRVVDQHVPWNGDFWAGKRDWWAVSITYYSFPANSPGIYARSVHPESGANSGNGRVFNTLFASGNYSCGLLNEHTTTMHTIDIRRGNRSDVQAAHNRAFSLVTAPIRIWGEFDNYSGYIRANRITNGRIRINFIDTFGNEHRFIVDWGGHNVWERISNG